MTLNNFINSLNKSSYSISKPVSGYQASYLATNKIICECVCSSNSKRIHQIETVKGECICLN